MWMGIFLMGRFTLVQNKVDTIAFKDYYLNGYEIFTNVNALKPLDALDWLVTSSASLSSTLRIWGATVSTTSSLLSILQTGDPHDTNCIKDTFSNFQPPYNFCYAWSCEIWFPLNLQHPPTTPQHLAIPPLPCLQNHILCQHLPHHRGWGGTVPRCVQAAPLQVFRIYCLRRIQWKGSFQSICNKHNKIN